MWFRNLQIFRLPDGWTVSPGSLEQSLAEHPLRPCAAMQAASRGWAPPLADSEALVASVDRHLLIALGIEKKLLPASVVRDEVAERVRRFTEERGFPPGRRTRQQFKDEAISGLLPRAFARRTLVRGWLDLQRGLLVVDAAAPNPAEELVEHLRETFGGSFACERLPTPVSPVSAMTEWLGRGSAPGGFDLGDEAELCSTDMERATVRYLRHSLHGEEIQRHLSGGKVVTRLGLSWREQLSFVLDDRMTLRRVRFLDVEQEEGPAVADPMEQFDQDFGLMTGMLGEMLDELRDALD